MNGEVINLARGVSSVASQILSPQVRKQDLNVEQNQIKSISVITGYVKKLGDKQIQRNVDKWGEEDFELPEVLDLKRKNPTTSPEIVQQNVDDVFRECHNNWGSPSITEQDISRKKTMTEAVITRLGSSKKRAHESENWDDLFQEIPDTGLRLKSSLQIQGIQNVDVLDISEGLRKAPLPSLNESLKKKTKEENEIKNEEDGLVLPTGIKSLKLPQTRHLSSANFNGATYSTSPKPPAKQMKTMSQIPAPSQARSESETENYDDLDFPDDPQKLKIATPKHSHEDDEFSQDLLIPEGMDLGKKLIKPGSRKSSKSSATTSEIKRKPSIRNSIQSTLFSGPVLVSTEIYGDGTELDKIEDLKVPIEDTNRLRERSNSQSTKPDKKRKKPILIQDKTSRTVPRVVENMRFNPETQTWEGNYEVLRHFEYVVPKLVTASSYVTPKVEGMRFIESTRSWKSVSGDVEDVFKDIPDLVVEKAESAPSFVITDELKEIFLESERQHNHFISKWTDSNNNLLVNKTQDEYRQGSEYFRMIAKKW